ncbi:hypothetical protein [Streptomyces sp. NBC_01653]|nr:hypothetical protein OH719_07085 [Streptomyces sp. NBC_01653]WTD37833.1 hypothetical protein OHB03_39845 [Streptomyces sp. NBC_01643]
MDIATQGVQQAADETGLVGVVEHHVPLGHVSAIIRFWGRTGGSSQAM